MKDVEAEAEVLSEAERAEKVKEEGNDFFRKGGEDNWKAAIGCYTRAIELCPTNSSYLSNRAAALVSLRRHSEAAADCEAAIALPHFLTLPPATRLKTLLRLGRCYLALADPLRALSQFSVALGLDAANAPVRNEMRRAEMMKAHLENVKRKREEGDWSMVLFALDKVEREGGVEQTPLEWKTWRLEALVHRDRFDDARGLATDLLRAAPSNPELLYLRGLILYHTDKSMQQAISHCRNALQNDPDFTKARLLMRQAQKLENLRTEGNDFFAKKEDRNAVEKYTEALGLELKNRTVVQILYSNRALCYQRLKEWDLALADCNSCLAMDSSNFKALRTRARVYQAMENYEAAVQDFKAAFQESGDGSAEEGKLRNELREAELLLKKSKRKNYYKILGGIPETATDDEIKKAYRKESLKHHPDKGGDEDKFKELGEAYAVLSDPQRRRRYDAGYDESDPSGGMEDMFGAGGMHGHPGFGVNLEDLFGAQFMGGGMGGGGSRRRGGGHSHFHSHSSFGNSYGF
ncbi:DnaJ-domain-containing protein [Atractiella rhizophila]|nr:DnaJ-domain-containing protein [Atractiella rhizophila]